MLHFQRLASRRVLFVLALGALTATAAGAGTIHRLAASQSAGAGSLGSTAFLNTSPGGGAVQAQVGPSTLTSLSYPFGLFGLYNSSQIGFGVVGLSTTAYGVAGESTSTYASVFGLSGGDEPAVEGMNPDTSSSAAPAGYFKAAAGDGIDVMTSNGTYGLSSVNTNFQSSAAGYFLGYDNGLIANGDGDTAACAAVSYDGVCTEGYGNGLEGIGDTSAGVYGHSTANHNSGGSGFGVYGIELTTAAPSQTDSPATYAGVYGQSTTGTGIYGISEACPNDCSPYFVGSQRGAGVFGYGNSGPGVMGYSRYDFGVYAQNSGTEPTLEVESLTGTGDQIVLQLSMDATGVGTYVDAVGNFYTAGKVTSGSDTFNAVSRNPNAGVMTYSTQQAEATVEDVGTARLVDGLAAVPLAADFRQTMNEAAPYMVIVTPYGESRGLYVASRAPGGFVVRENGGGRSTLQFDYRVVAQPYGSRQPRLPRIRDDMRPHAPSTRTIASTNTHLPSGAEPLIRNTSIFAAHRKAALAHQHAHSGYQPAPIPQKLLNLTNLHH